MTSGTTRSLVDQEAGPCVSVYMPTHRSGREIQQGPIRLGNLLDRAREELVASGMGGPEADELLAAAHRLVVSGSFWQFQEDGLALLIAADRIVNRSGQSGRPKA